MRNVKIQKKREERKNNKIKNSKIKEEEKRRQISVKMRNWIKIK